MKKLILMIYLVLISLFSLYTQANKYLQITSDIDKVNIYINDTEIGLTPITTTIRPGKYILTAKKNKYQTQSFWIEITQEPIQEIKIDLQLNTRKITFDITPPESEIQIDNTLLLPEHIYNGYEISPGVHKILVKKFGYESFSESIIINPNEDFIFSHQLIESNLKITKFNISNNIINPNNPTEMSKLTINFEISKNQAIDLLIKNIDNQIVKTIHFDSFISPNNTYNWNLLDDNNTILSNGEYFIFTNENTFLAKFIINSNTTKAFLKTSKNGTGNINAITANILPKNSFGVQIHSEINLLNPNINTYAIPNLLSITYCPTNFIETSLITGLSLLPNFSNFSTTPFVLGGNVKINKTINNYCIAGIISYIYQTQNDFILTDNGLKFGCAFSFNQKNFTINYSTFLVFSSIKGDFSTPTITDEFSWNNGLSLDFYTKNSNTTLSVSLFNFDSFIYGISYLYYLPKSSIFINLDCFCKHTTTEFGYLSPGISFGFLF